jgi:hypothetical protein
MHPSRRELLALAAASVAGSLRAQAAPTSLFNGKTLDGWTQIENNATSLSAAGIADPAAFAAKLATASDPVSVLLRARLSDALKADLAAYSPSAANAKAVISALVKELNQILSGPPIAGPGGPSELETARLNKRRLEDAYPAELPKSASTGWVVKDGAMTSTGAGRGVIYTDKDYSRFRLSFTMRHVSGNPDHQACVLIFCTRPQPGELPLDALAGIQFQVPNGGHWDYRPGRNNNGGPAFTTLNKTRFDPHEWSRAEIVADAATGVARMTVAQPPESQPIEVLAFQDPAAGKSGPIAWQMHNAGLIDEFKDIELR